LISSSSPTYRPQYSVEKLQQFYDKVFDYLHEKDRIYDRFDTGESSEFKKLIVSDAIVLSVKLPEALIDQIRCCARFFAAISLLQGLLAFEQDIWMRGSVSVGNLFIDETRNILVGPAFVQAYQLEQNADYPRIIIDPRVCDRLSLTQNTFRDRINAAGNGENLLPNTGIARMGRHAFPYDAIQIDWFRHCFDRGVQLDKFFSGLRRRMTSSQSLFEKSLKTGRYLRESCDFELHNRQRNHNGRLAEIELKLTDLGF
jgi:hypothetical protein